MNLCRELEPHLKPNECFVRAQVDVKKQVAIAIYLLGSSVEYRTIENLFGVSTSTVCKVVHMVCDAMGFRTAVERLVVATVRLKRLKTHMVTT